MKSAPFFRSCLLAAAVLGAQTAAAASKAPVELDLPLCAAAPAAIFAAPPAALAEDLSLPAADAAPPAALDEAAVSAPSPDQNHSENPEERVAAQSESQFDQARPASPADDALLARLRERVALTAENDKQPAPAEQAAFQRAAIVMLKSPLARTLMQDLLNEQARGNVHFRPLGKKVAGETQGGTFGSKLLRRIVPGYDFSISLNSAYLDGSFLAEDLPGVLAHELLGHALKDLQAAGAGIDEAYNLHTYNEINARIVGWIVALETGSSLRLKEMLEFLYSRDLYVRGMQTQLPYYSGTFRVAELADPVAVLKSRRDRAAAEPEIVKYLDKRISWYSSWLGRWHLQDMREAFEHPFFTKAEGEIERLTKRLSNLVI